MNSTTMFNLLINRRFRISPVTFWITFVLIPWFQSGIAQQAQVWELSAAYGILACQSSYGFQTASGVEATAGRSLHNNLRADVGVRLGINPVLPDVFLRLLAVQQFGIWRPGIGLESGYSNRVTWDDNGTMLLQETRDALTEDVGYTYIAAQAEPLVFAWPNGWGISALEVNIGTHFKHFGQTMRLQATFLRLRKTF
jgi:hypothetical protein